MEVKLRIQKTNKFCKQVNGNKKTACHTIVTAAMEHRSVQETKFSGNVIGRARSFNSALPMTSLCHHHNNSIWPPAHRLTHTKQKSTKLSTVLYQFAFRYEKRQPCELPLVRRFAKPTSESFQNFWKNFWSLPIKFGDSKPDRMAGLGWAPAVS